MITVHKPLVRHNNAPTFASNQKGLDVADGTGVGPPDGNISASDALTVINFINAFGPKKFAATDFGPPYVDVDGDESVAAGDALTIINYINAFGPGNTDENPQGEAEGASQDALFADEAPGSSFVLTRAEDSIAVTLNELIELLALDVAAQPKRRR
jgi:hypothetical protein